MRELLIEIDCDEQMCGKCAKHSEKGYCRVFSADTSDRLKMSRAAKDFRRHKLCIGSEVEA